MDSDNSDIYLGAAHYPADQFKHLHMVSGFKKSSVVCWGQGQSKPKRRNADNVLGLNNKRALHIIVRPPLCKPPLPQRLLFSSTVS